VVFCFGISGVKQKRKAKAKAKEKAKEKADAKVMCTSEVAD
jgi:hypothetical protein